MSVTNSLTNVTFNTISKVEQMHKIFSIKLQSQSQSQLQLQLKLRSDRLCLEKIFKTVQKKYQISVKR